MVAGLTCHAGDAYNRFVLAHRAELQRSDDDLKAYFVRNGGEAGYDAYKTKMANLAAHGPATDLNAFCSIAGKDFQALANSGDLQTAAGYEALLAGKACDAPQLAANRPDAAPVRLASAADAISETPRALPAMPYAEAPPPAPMPQPVAAGPQDMMDAARPPAVETEAAPLPRPPERGDRYWYYRQIYRDYYRGR
jgi:hypothetical protein